MMNILEYANDINVSVAKILSVCKELDIKVESEEDILDDNAIVSLDNYFANIPSLENEEEINIDTEEILEKYEELEEIKKEKTTKNKVSKKVITDNDNFSKERKEMYKNREKLQSNSSILADDVILYDEGMTISKLAELLKVTGAELVKKLMLLGIMTNINQTINFETAEIICLDYDKKLEKSETKDESNFEMFEVIDEEKDLVSRPPVVTIMGHVDHGKTTLLDYIRKASVTETEAGGITQAIGAYQTKCQGKIITFIDTPGHAAFTEMRARGASVTDIVIIIVAADDGIKPQTKEAIDHAKAAGVPIIVAINKMDKPNINPERVLTELSENGITPEEWGGDVMVVRISAITGMGIEDLLERVLLIAELQNLKANPSRYALGTVIEAKMDKNIGSVATLLVQNGTLRIGDPIVVGKTYGKVRTLKDSNGLSLTSALPSTPVEITGLGDVVMAGDKFMAYETEKEAKHISSVRALKMKEKDTNLSGTSLEDLFSKIKEGIKEINVVLKTDVQGSLEAVKNSLEKIAVEEVRVKVIRSGVGTITENDILLAATSNAIVIGFNVRPNAKTKEVANEYKIDIKLYNIIYKVVEDMELAMKGMLEPIFEEVITGSAIVRKLFKFSKVGIIAGSYIQDGLIKRGSNARLIRDGVVLYDGKINTIQREKDQAKEVKAGLECGLTLENYLDIKENDIIETYEMKELKR